jgi:hypothetical protein
MGKIFMIGLILGIMVLSFYSISFADEEAKGISPTNSLNELIHGQSILHRKGEDPLAFPKKAGLGITLNGLERDLFHSENSQPSKGKSGYHFGKIHLINKSLDHSLDFISRLAVAQFKEENPPSWTLEKFKENDIFKSLAIFLELKLNF